MQRHDGHGHSHADSVTSLLAGGSADGIRALKIGAAGLAATAAVQLAIVAVSGSAALFSDALHNVGDVLTTVALWIAFVATRRASDDRYTFGYQRFEDVAGLAIVIAIFASGALAAFESYAHIRDAQSPRRILLAMGAALVGVVGNELVAQVKIRSGRRIGSEALVAEGQHSRVDGLVSAAALAGLGGAWLGAPWADPVAGLVIAGMIVWLGVQSGRPILAKLVDRVDAEVVNRIAQVAAAVDGVLAVHSIRARYAGRALYVLLHVELPPEISLRDAHSATERVRHDIVHALPQVVQVDVHADPSGRDHHEATSHHFDD